MWCRCDLKSGYVYEFDLYTSKKHDKTEHGFGEAVILQLTQNIRDLNFQVFIVYFFNSPNLQLMLLDRNVYSRGNVRAYRKNMPKSMIPADKGMERGDVACFTSNCINCLK